MRVRVINTANVLSNYGRLLQPLRQCTRPCTNQSHATATNRNRTKQLLLHNYHQSATQTNLRTRVGAVLCALMKRAQTADPWTELHPVPTLTGPLDPPPLPTGRPDGPTHPSSRGQATSHRAAGGSEMQTTTRIRNTAAGMTSNRGTDSKYNMTLPRKQRGGGGGGAPSRVPTETPLTVQATMPQTA